MHKDDQQKMELGLQKIIEWCYEQPERLNALIKPEFIKCSSEEQSAEISFSVEDWQLNPRAILHGGMIATIFDVALGALAHYTYSKGGLSTTDLTVSYIRPVSADSVSVKAVIKASGNTLVRVYGEMYSKDSGKLAATAMATYIPIQRR